MINMAKKNKIGKETNPYIAKPIAYKPVPIEIIINAGKWEILRVTQNWNSTTINAFMPNSNPKYFSSNPCCSKYR